VATCTGSAYRCLVVSAYTPPGTVSGAIGLGTPTYPPPPQWTHDFGILKFTENNFLGPTAQIAPSGYTYADSNSLDAVYQGQPVVPLWEFFLGSYCSFTPILPTSSAYDANYFMNYYTTRQSDGTYPTPTGPDGGPDD
jgi:hypothetical protein